MHSYKVEEKTNYKDIDDRMLELSTIDWIKFKGGGVTLIGNTYIW